MRNNSVSVVIQLAAYYGRRRSGVLGIRWSAVDFDRGTISINHRVTEGKESASTMGNMFIRGGNEQSA